ncbi:MAG: UDP-N-acetylmuramate dehydrogenase [Candidatus Wildermuthbacteria bacterium]|nr:UDP-N-acetylmuramate dehydrogenase [Candidatus Wildermuthbacteria bacterium]
MKLPGLKKDVALAPYTTFGIGGKARYFFPAKNKEDIVSALQFGKKARLPVFILGGGSNLLVSDRGFNGLVIKMDNKRYEARSQNVYAEAGVLMSRLVNLTVKRGLKGFEWAGGLPGTLGGAIRGNAGAFGGETKDSVMSVQCIDGAGKTRELSARECGFSYRSSVFKRKNWIVVSAQLKFSKGNPADLRKTAQGCVKYREDRHPLNFGNAGSIFKNCDLKEIPPALLDFVKPVVKRDPFPVVPVAFLISEAGLKGSCQGDAQVSEKHPNFIVNKGHATSKDVMRLIKKVKKVVMKRFHVPLEMEVQCLK